LAGLASAVMGFVVQGCFAPQPPPECTVFTGAAGTGVSNYFAKLDNKTDNGNAACADAPSNSLRSLTVGMTRLAPPRATQFQAILRTSFLVDAYNGGTSNHAAVYTGNQDGTNDCSRSTSPGKCEYCVVGTAPALTFADGGVAVDTTLLSDGGIQGIPVPGADAGADGGFPRIVLTNSCRPTIEEIPRVDPNDPDGERIYEYAAMPQFPDKNGVCSLTGFDGGVQNFQEETLVSGSLPALTVANNWSSFDIINNTKAPASYFTAKLSMTEGACVTNWDVTGFWPIITCCATDADGECMTDADGNIVPNDAACDPVADLDAGRVFGSGISPYFKSKCDKFVGVCVPTATAAELKAN
jgi:hypothetical protein